MLNEADHIIACLESVEQQTYSNVVETLLVDGGSADHTVPLASARGGVTVLNNPRRIQAAALNIALERARGEIVVRVDGHTVLDRQHIERSVAALLATGAAMVGGVMEPEGTTCFGRGVALAMCSRFGAGPAPYRHGGFSGWTDSVYLGAFWVNRAREVGGYSELVGVNEDAEFALRMRELGGVWLEDAIRVRYTPRQNPKALAIQYFRYGLSRAATIRTHPHSMRPRHLAPVALVLAACLGRRPAIPSAYLALVLCHAATRLKNDPCAAQAMAIAIPTMHFSWATGLLIGLAWRRP